MPDYEEVTDASERKPTNEEKDSLTSNRYCSSGPQSPENDHEYTTVSLLYTGLFPIGVDVNNIKKLCTYQCNAPLPPSQAP